jgi:hypothetical protein
MAPLCESCMRENCTCSLGGGRRPALERASSDPTAKRPANKAGQPAAERVERRAEAEGNTRELRTRRTQGRDRLPQWFARVRHTALPSLTRGGSPVRELRTPGSVRGVLGNGHPYRDTPS